MRLLALLINFGEHVPEPLNLIILLIGHISMMWLSLATVLSAELNGFERTILAGGNILEEAWPLAIRLPVLVSSTAYGG